MISYQNRTSISTRVIIIDIVLVVLISVDNIRTVRSMNKTTIVVVLILILIIAVIIVVVELLPKIHANSSFQRSNLGSQLWKLFSFRPIEKRNVINNVRREALPRHVACCGQQRRQVLTIMRRHVERVGNEPDRAFGDGATRDARLKRKLNEITQNFLKQRNHRRIDVLIRAVCR